MLIKFGQYVYMKALLEKGTIYMQALRNYADIEHDQIGDCNEGLSYSLTKDVKVEVDGVEIQEITGAVRIVDSTGYNPLVYCMYSLAPEYFETKGSTIDPRCCGFGDYAVLIKSDTEFLNRLSSVFKDNCAGLLKGDLVNYVNQNSYNGEMGAFRKYDKYSYQREYRYVWEGGDLNDRAVLTIGDLSDIAVLLPSEKLNGLIKIRHNQSVLKEAKRSR